MLLLFLSLLLLDGNFSSTTLERAPGRRSWAQEIRAPGLEGWKRSEARENVSASIPVSRCSEKIRIHDSEFSKEILFKTVDRGLFASIATLIGVFRHEISIPDFGELRFD